MFTRTVDALCGRMRYHTVGTLRQILLYGRSGLPPTMPPAFPPAGGPPSPTAIQPSPAAVAVTCVHACMHACACCACVRVGCTWMDVCVRACTRLCVGLCADAPRKRSVLLANGAWGPEAVVNHLDFALVGCELPQDVHAGDCAARCGACNGNRHSTLRLELVCCMMHAVGCISQEVCCLRVGHRVLFLASEVTSLLIDTSCRLRTKAKDGKGSRNARAACMQSIRRLQAMATARLRHQRPLCIH